MRSSWNFFTLIASVIIFISCSTPSITKQHIEITQTVKPTETQLTPTVENKKSQEPVLLTQYTFPYDLLTINDLYFIDENIGWAVGELMWYDPQEDKTFCCKVAIFNTANGGVNWKKVEIEDVSGLLNSIIFINSSTGYIVGQEFSSDYLALLLYTSDGGKTWAKVDLNHTRGRLNDIVFTKDSQYWSAGGGGLNSESLILETQDGINWQKQEHPSYISARITALSFPNSTVGYAIGVIGSGEANPYLIKTSDNGNNWEEIKMPFYSGRLLDVIFINEEVGYMVGTQGSSFYLFITKNGGTNWAEIVLSQEIWSSWLRKVENHLFLFGTCIVSEDCENLVAIVEDEQLIPFENLTFSGEMITGVGNMLNINSFTLVTNIEIIHGVNPSYQTTFYKFIFP